MMQKLFKTNILKRVLIWQATIFMSSIFSGCAVNAHSERIDIGSAFASRVLHVYNKSGDFLPNPECLCYSRYNIEPSGYWLNDIVALGKRYLGKPYRYRGPGYSFDCSGYMRFLFNSIGIPLASSSSSMAKTTIPIKNPKPGDLLFFTGRNSRSGRVGHVALLIDITPKGDYVMLHSTCSGGVVLEEMNNSCYFRTRYLGAGRIPILKKDFETRINKQLSEEFPRMEPIPPSFDPTSPKFRKAEQMPMPYRIPFVPIVRS